MFKRNRISPQYLRKDEIFVTIIEIKNPVHFILKESPSINLSSEAKHFVEAEETMQQYYRSIEEPCFPLPQKESIVVVLDKNKFYRAEVRSILSVTEGHRIKVYLLDYGRECIVQRQCLYEIHQDFLVHPFQAVDFKLQNLEPVSLVMGLQDLKFDYGPVPTWDISAKEFIQDMRKGMNSAHIKVKGVVENCLFGSLHMTFEDSTVKCINEELILKKYARQVEDCGHDVTSIDTILSNLELHHVVKPPGIATAGSSSLSPQKCSPTANAGSTNLSPLKYSSTVTSSSSSLSPPKFSPTVIAGSASLSPSTCSLSALPSSQKPKIHSPISPAASNHIAIQKFKKLKSRKLSEESSNSLPSSAVSDQLNCVSPTCAKENETLDSAGEKKYEPPENIASIKTPNNTANPAKIQSSQLMKYRSLKPSSCSPPKACSSSTPLSNQVSSNHSPSPQSTCDRVQSVSPITGLKTDILTQKLHCIPPSSNDENISDTAFINRQV